MEKEFLERRPRKPDANPGLLSPLSFRKEDKAWNNVLLRSLRRDWRRVEHPLFCSPGEDCFTFALL